MKVSAGEREKRGTEGGVLHTMHEHKGPGRHIPPHERRGLMHVEFSEEDRCLLEKVFGDEDTAAAAEEIIREAPPEIQILAIQLMNIIEEVA